MADLGHCASAGGGRAVEGTAAKDGREESAAASFDMSFHPRCGLSASSRDAPTVPRDAFPPLPCSPEKTGFRSKDTPNPRGTVAPASSTATLPVPPPLQPNSRGRAMLGRWKSGSGTLDTMCFASPFTLLIAALTVNKPARLPSNPAGCWTVPGAESKVSAGAGDGSQPRQPEPRTGGHGTGSGLCPAAGKRPGTGAVGGKGGFLVSFLV